MRNSYLYPMDSAPDKEADDSGIRPCSNPTLGCDRSIVREAEHDDSPDLKEGVLFRERMASDHGY